jgi:hypothetical protein
VGTESNILREQLPPGQTDRNNVLKPVVVMEGGRGACGTWGVAAARMGATARHFPFIGDAKANVSYSAFITTYFLPA